MYIIYTYIYIYIERPQLYFLNYTLETKTILYTIMYIYIYIYLYARIGQNGEYTPISDCITLRSFGIEFDYTYV